MIEPGKLNGYLVAIKEELRKAGRQASGFLRSTAGPGITREPGRYYAFELLSQKSSICRGDRVHINTYVSRLNRDNPLERWVVLRI